MCSLILKPIPCLQNESISLTSIVKFILKVTHTSQKIMFHLLCFKWGRGGGYTTPSTQSKSDVGGGFGWTMRFLLIYYNYSTSVLSTGLELGSVKL